MQGAQMTQQYQEYESSSDYSDDDYGCEGEEEETESSAIDEEEDYGEDDDSQESSFTDHNPHNPGEYQPQRYSHDPNYRPYPLQY